jgi:hypothetical protein
VVTAMRVPVVAGVGGGVGTTIVAAALRGHDAGRVTAGWPDILVCRGTLDSLRRAAAVLETADPDAFPVLAVTLDAARATRRPIRAHLERLEPDLGALVVLPCVRRWATLADPVAEAAHLLEEPADRLPRPLRAYAAALRELVEAVTASGRLDAAPDRPQRRRPGSDERDARHSGSGDRHIRPVGSEQLRAQRTGSGEGNVRRVARDERVVRRESGATVRPPDLAPAGTAAPQRPRGVQVVRPDLPRGEPVRRAERVG